MKERNGSAVAIIGAGPSGIYAADALARSGAVRQVDVIDALPAPFGLARYGVAPDHLKTRNIVTVLSAVFEQTNVRFLGNVRLGRDVTVEQLRDCYAATVLAVGQSADRRLTEACVDVNDRQCLTECPVDYIYEGARMLYVNPDECIDCSACEPLSPIQAIFHEDELPDDLLVYRDINREFFTSGRPRGGAREAGIASRDPSRGC